MKLTYAQIPAWRKQMPDSTRAVLVYGPDSGQVDEVFRALALQRCPDMEDSFSVHRFQADDIASDDGAFFAACLSPSLMGERPVVLVRQAGDKMTAVMKPLLEKLTVQDAFVLLAAGDLAKKSSLRALFEAKTPDIAALPCYADDARSLAGLLRTFCQENRLSMAPEAATMLQAVLGSDRAVVRSELEKLRLYIGDRQHIALADVEACATSARSFDYDDVLYAVLEGNAAAALASWQSLQEEGEYPAVVLRALQNHLHRLLQVQAACQEGTPLDSAIKSLRPPLFFKVEPRFRALLKTLPAKRLYTLLHSALQAEQTLKSSAALTETFPQFLLQVAAIANGQRMAA